jgi:hypothetical protein
MDTDEYEMSLARELAVCRGHIEAIEKSLARSEERDRSGAAGAGAELGSGAAAAAMRNGRRSARPSIAGERGRESTKRCSGPHATRRETPASDPSSRS